MGEHLMSSWLLINSVQYLAALAMPFVEEEIPQYTNSPHKKSNSSKLLPVFLVVVSSGKSMHLRV